MGLAGRLCRPALLARRQTGLQIVALALGQRQVGFLRPTGKLIQARTAQQEAAVLSSLLPFLGSSGQQALLAHVGAAFAQPGAQARPLAQQGLVRHFYRRPARQRIMVKGQQAVGAKGVEHLADGGRRTADGRQTASVDLGASRQPFEFGAQHAPAGIFALFAQRHQAQENLPGGRLLALVQAGIDLFGAAPQSLHHPPALFVSRQSQFAPGAAFEQFGQGVLQQRQCTGLVADFLDNSVHQFGFRQQANAFSRAVDRQPQFIRGKRQDEDRALAQQFTQVDVLQGAVDKVGPQGDHHTQAAARIHHGGHQAVQEMGAHGLAVSGAAVFGAAVFGAIFHQSEQFLELVDHQQQVSHPIVGQNAAHGAQQAARFFANLIQQAGRRVNRHAQQSRFQFFQRVRAGRHLGDKPVFRAGQAAALDSRQETRLDDR